MQEDLKASQFDKGSSFSSVDKNPWVLVWPEIQTGKPPAPQFGAEPTDA